MKNTFYSSIADNYDYIFPYNPLQVDFLKLVSRNLIPNRALEVGCGTGNLSIGLAGVFDKVVGVDLDAEMIRKAKVKGLGMNVEFEQLDMLALAENFELAGFDAITCFGNALVHLNDLQQVENFIASTKQILTKTGSLNLQIINYDRVLDKKIKSLETIENDHIRFIRNYDYIPSENKIDFKTELLLKQQKECIKNSQHLLPIRKQELNNILKKYFENIKYYGSFKGGLWDEGAIPLIVSASND